MVENTDQAEELRAAQEYFRSLEIEGWEETNSPVQGGGQATILVVKRADGTKGAFRFSTKSDEKSLERFSREIKILSEYEHPNILRILAHSKDPSRPWYISELGSPFRKYWERRRQQFVDEPEQLVSSAVDVLRQLAEGLAPLHGRGVVHRDIKPANIIINSNDPGRERPVLIDFGLAHVESEPRLSDVDEAVGNLRFSPDVAMYRMDNVPPWLDVHNLAQLFIWMARIRPDKDWSRAVDWRWVNYDKRLSDDLALSIKALTAQCSEQTVGPENAGDLITLIDQLFPQISSTSPTLINASGIEEGRRRGMATSSLAEAEDARIIEASFPVAAKTYLTLCQEFESLFVSGNAVGIKVSKVSDIGIDNFRHQLLDSTLSGLELQLISWEVGDGSGNTFNFRIQGQAVLPSRRSEYLAIGGKFPSDSSNPFLFYLHLYRNQTRGPFPYKIRALTLDSQGSLFLRNVYMDETTATSIPEIVTMVKEWMEDPDVWEALHKYK